MPSRLGSSTSMISDVGLEVLDDVDDLAAVAGLADDLDDAASSTIRALIASRTISWSSQRTTRFAVGVIAHPAAILSGAP